MNKEKFLKLQKFILEKEKYKEKIRFYFDIHEDLKFTFFKFNDKSTSLEYDKKLDLFLSELNTTYGELIIEKISVFITLMITHILTINIIMKIIKNIDLKMKN